MPVPFDFSELPRARHFDIQVIAPPLAAMTRSRPKALPMWDIVAIKAIGTARENPDKTVGTRFSFLETSKWLIPTCATMQVDDLRVMETLVKYGEAVHQKARAYNAERISNFESRDFLLRWTA